MGRLAAPTHDSDGRHEMVSPFFDDIKWDGVSCLVTYDTLCQFLHGPYLFLARWDTVFTFRGRWGDGGNGFTDCP